MKRFAVKLSIIIFTVALLISAVSVTAFADGRGFNSIIVLGDSISTGYGLDGTIYTRKNYSNLLKEKLGADTIVNLAVDGYTSTNMISVINSSESDIKDKDLIVFSIGGNDLLVATRAVISKELSLASDDLFNVLTRIVVVSDEKLYSVFDSDTAKNTYGQMFATLETNLNTIFTKLKEINPTAEIVMLNQYNLFDGAVNPKIQLIADCASDIIVHMNEVIGNTAKKYGVRICNTFTAFAGQCETYTRLASIDIHPSEAGHALICDMIYNMLMNPETSDPVLIPFTAALVSGLGMAVTLTVRKKKKVK